MRDLANVVAGESDGSTATLSFLARWAMLELHIWSVCASQDRLFNVGTVQSSTFCSLFPIPVEMSPVVFCMLTHCARRQAERSASYARFFKMLEVCQVSI